MRRIYVYLSILAMVSCNAQEKKFQSQLIKCINNNFSQKYSDFNHPFEQIENEQIGIIDTIKKFEEYLINHQILKAKTREGYIKLISGLKKNSINIDFSNMQRQNYFLDFSNRNLPIVLIMYDICPQKVIEDTKAKELGKVITIYDDIFSTGTIKINTIEELAATIDFNKEVLRLSLSNLIYSYLIEKNSSQKTRTKNPPKF